MCSPQKGFMEIVKVPNRKKCMGNRELREKKEKIWVSGGTAE